MKLVERNRVKDFNFSFELGGTNWLCNIILEAVEFEGKNGFLENLEVIRMCYWLRLTPTKRQFLED